MTEMTEWKTPIFAELSQRLAAVDETIASRRVLSEEQLHWRPHDKCWSTAQTLDHLRITAQQYLPQIAAALKKAPASPCPPADLEWRSAPLGRMFAHFLKRPKPLPAPAAFVPHKRPEAAIDNVLQSHRLVAEALTRCNGLPARKLKVTSPVSRLLRFNLGDCFQIITLHAERHLGQIEGILSASDLPA